MRLIVPLQAVVQGRGGLVLGSLIPCALFYFLQFYLRRHRPSSSSSPPPSSSSESNLPELTSMHRSFSRNLLSPRGSAGPSRISSRGAALARGDDNPYYVGLKRCAEDPYDASSNPDGFVQLGLAENRVRDISSYFYLSNSVFLFWFRTIIFTFCFFAS